LLGGKAALSASTVWAERIAHAMGIDVMTEFYVERLERGTGRPNFGRIPYGAKAASQLLSPYRQIVLVCASPPVAFFGYPDQPGRLSAPACHHILIADHDQDAAAALEALAQALDVPPTSKPPAVERRSLITPDERLSPESVGHALAALLPADAIVVDEAITSGRVLHDLTRHAAPHDWLSCMGGSIGYGLPVAVGAAIAAPGRRVIALEGDGSAMYTVQSLWTMARESLDVTVVIYANRKYDILLGEYRSVGGSELGERARRLLTIGEPNLDWCSLARGMGVASERVTCTSEFITAFKRANHTPGPSLIEVVLA
jgi:acetolactate synthase-1/2/3 large subunit